MSPPVHKLTAPEVAAELRRRLAAGETHQSLADHYGVDRSSITAFKIRNAATITQLRAQLQDAAAQVDGLWITGRVDRLALIQDVAERTLRELEDADVDRVPELTRTFLAAVHEAAEQLGQLPSRTQVNVQTVVNYRFDGVDLEQL